ncbi:FMN-binding glutamate synthase family protein [Corynebacterium renale]|uniref:Glutamate synthase domain-containing protein 2 n=1 Tax=Corynebacterium renale TaxID=1724 RepID=A0A2A9DP51_9CORY|nr:FMN-binding glutamate synthase family protein [Corynebacterium renale]PFG27700.1 glutamate synthase domain-containing protein 2 [Corynebacterium renale]SQI22252.1 putative glutamate synthase [Corynebacterium renale]
MAGKNRMGKGKLAALAGALSVGALAARDLTQKKHSILRIYPVLGHARYALEAIRPELQQYFIERNWDGRPFDRNTRSLIYSRAKGQTSTTAFGTQEDVYAQGHRSLIHSMRPLAVPEEPARVMIGGPQCDKPYSCSLLNVSAMSFGSLSGRAVEALNKGAEMGGFYHDTGEGGLSPHHTKHNGDLVWELGTGYFGARTPDGGFDDETFARKAQSDQVKMTLLKISQGAKPGLGGELPASKVTEEVAEIRGIPVGKAFTSPGAHSEFDTPKGMLEFLDKMRRLSGGKPVGFKLCVGSRQEFLAVCKAMLETNILPDYIVVDGAEGGTGSAPKEFEDHVGMPLTEGLTFVHNALVGCGLREHIKIGAAGKIAAGNDIVRRLVQGADFLLSARAMMMAIGCVQAMECHLGTCPAGVATQDKWRERALDVPDKAMRVKRYQAATVASAMKLMATMGATNPSELRPDMIRCNDDYGKPQTYAERYQWLDDGQLTAGDIPDNWAADWAAASADTFARV